jgi:hypothetical protein
MAFLKESNFIDVETISESLDTGGKNWYIKGIMAQGGIINRNKRIYPSEVLSESMSIYENEYVKTSRAVGELEHPDSGQINLERISHIIETLERVGDNYYGKAKVLNTPTGRIVAGLLEGGVKLGVSTRADGKVVKNSQGINEVQRGLRMNAVDVVFHPSAQGAMVDGLMENDNFIWNTMGEDEELLENIKKGVKVASREELMEAKVNAFNRLIELIRSK